MSGIYIPGMEMPTSCGECEWCVHTIPADKYICKRMKRAVIGVCETDVETVNVCCPLVPVPEHGRLGDLDELLDRAFGCLDEETFLAFQFLVNGSVTVIPPSKEDSE